MKHLLYILLAAAALAGCSNSAEQKYKAEIEMWQDSLDVLCNDPNFGASANRATLDLAVRVNIWNKIDSLTYLETKTVFSKSQFEIITKEHNCWLALCENLDCVNCDIACIKNWDDPYCYVLGLFPTLQMHSMHYNMYTKDIEMFESNKADTANIKDVNKLSQMLVYVCQGMYYNISKLKLNKNDIGWSEQDCAEEFYWHKDGMRSDVDKLPATLNKWVSARQQLAESFKNDKAKQATIRKNTADFLQEVIYEITY